MNELADALVSGLEEREASVGATLTWAGAVYPCCGGSELRGKKLDLGGFQFNNTDLAVIARVAVFPGAKPAARQTIIYTSAPGASPLTWRIESVQNLWGEVLVLQCTDPAQGA